jgi:hypothetical protein
MPRTQNYGQARGRTGSALQPPDLRPREILAECSEDSPHSILPGQAAPAMTHYVMTHYVKLPRQMVHLFCLGP